MGVAAEEAVDPVLFVAVLPIAIMVLRDVIHLVREEEEVLNLPVEMEALLGRVHLPVVKREQ